jgi:hypothetical protein
MLCLVPIFEHNERFIIIQAWNLTLKMGIPWDFHKDNLINPKKDRLFSFIHTYLCSVIVTFS